MGLKIKDLVDDDIAEYGQELKLLRHEVLLLQILRELRKEGPEERSKPIKGFGRSGTDVSEPYHPF